QSSADNADARWHRKRRQEFAEGAFMAAQHEALKSRGAQDESLQALERKEIEPAQHRGPGAAPRSGLWLSQLRPVRRGVGVMFDVVAIVEEKGVVDRSVMARRLPAMLVVAMQTAQPKSEQVAGDVHREEEPRRAHQ